MKPGIPETGTVIRLEGDQALVRMKNDGGSCHKCGVAAAGLCTGSLMRTVTARNTKQARIGDLVKIGLRQRVQFAGYALAYVIPATALVLGSVAGHYVGFVVRLPAMDITCGFFSLLTASWFSFRRLKRLDAISAIEIVDVLYDPWDPGTPR